MKDLNTSCITVDCQPCHRNTPPYLQPPHWAPPPSPQWQADHSAAGRGCGGLCSGMSPCHWRWRYECKWLLSECRCSVSHATPDGCWNLHGGCRHWGGHSGKSERRGSKGNKQEFMNILVIKGRVEEHAYLLLDFLLILQISYICVSNNIV